MLSLVWVNLPLLVMLIVLKGCGTMALTAAYSVPVFMSVLAGRKHVKGAVWSLGRLGWFCNIVTILYVPLAFVLFSSPT